MSERYRMRMYEHLISFHPQVLMLHGRWITESGRESTRITTYPVD